MIEKVVLTRAVAFLRDLPHKPFPTIVTFLAILGGAAWVIGMILGYCVFG